MIKYTEAEMLRLTPKEYRSLVRRGDWTSATRNVCSGYTMTDVVILPKEYAYDFLLFSHRNPQVCPILDITEVGSPHPPLLAPDADLRTDLPRYRVYKDGQVVDEPTDITKYWRDDLVAFLLGCGANFIWVLRGAGIHFQENGVFSTNTPCIPVGPFHGNVAAPCRLFETARDVIRAIQIASRHFLMNGPPIHIGDPVAIGIKDLSQPDLLGPCGQIPPRQPYEGEIAVFWPCFGTVRGVAVEAKLPLMIVDYPRCNLMTDKLIVEFAIL